MSTDCWATLLHLHNLKLQDCNWDRKVRSFYTFSTQRQGCIVSLYLDAHVPGSKHYEPQRSIGFGAALGFPDTPEEAASAWLVSKQKPQDAYLVAIERAKCFIWIEKQYCWEADEIKLRKPELDTRCFMIYDQTTVPIGHVRPNATMYGNDLTHAFLTTENEWLDHVDAPGTCLGKLNKALAEPGYSAVLPGFDMVETKARDEAGRVLSRMKDRFATLLSSDSDSMSRVWTGKEDIPSITKTVRSASLKLLSCMAVLRLDDDVDRIENSLLLALVDSTSSAANKSGTSFDPLTSSTWEENDRSTAQVGFVIFASDGLWDLLSNKKVADIVQKNPEEGGVATSLISEGLVEVARNKRKSYDDMLNVKVESRNRHLKVYYDNITVVGETNFTALDGVT